MRKPENMTIQEMATKYVNKKTALGSLALLFGVAMIALFTFVPYSWEPERLLSNRFITDSMIIVAITILGMVCLIFISQANNANNKASKISQSMAAFKQTKEKITDKHAFKQWVRRVQQPKDLQLIKERILMKVGIDDLSVLRLSEPEVKALLDTPQKYGDTYYPALNKAQVKTVLSVKNGVKMRFPVPEVYLSAKAVLDGRTTSERLDNEGSKKRNYAMLSIVSKVIMTLLVSMIFTMFVRDLATQVDPLGASGVFATRMTNLFTSSLMGYIVGGQLNDIDAEYVDLRVEVFEEYLADKEFKPISAQEEAREQYVERVQKEQSAQTTQRLDGDCLTGAPNV